jgi:hypothetical protein
MPLLFPKGDEMTQGRSSLKCPICNFSVYSIQAALGLNAGVKKGSHSIEDCKYCLRCDKIFKFIPVEYRMQEAFK